jgi:hypothetical protein
MSATPDPALTSGLNQIMAAVDRVKMSIEVQKLIASVQSACETYYRVVSEDFKIAKEVWKMARTLLDEIENKVNTVTAPELVAYKELQQVVKCAGQVGANLDKDNQGEAKTAYEGMMKNLVSASLACRDWNEIELTKIRVVTYKLLNP